VNLGRDDSGRDGVEDSTIFKKGGEGRYRAASDNLLQWGEKPQSLKMWRLLERVIFGSSQKGKRSAGGKKSLRSFGQATSGVA